jgi:hypothetical protein
LHLIKVVSDAEHERFKKVVKSDIVNTGIQPGKLTLKENNT